MNTVQLIGRLTRAPEVRYSQGSVPLAVARYTYMAALPLCSR